MLKGGGAPQFNRRAQAVYHAWEFLDNQQSVKNKEYVRRNWKKMNKWMSQAKNEMAELKKKNEEATAKCKELSDRLQSLEQDKKELQQRFEEKCREKRKLEEMFRSSSSTPARSPPPASNHQDAPPDNNQYHQSGTIIGTPSRRFSSTTPQSPTGQHPSSTPYRNTAPFQVGPRANSKTPPAQQSPASNYRPKATTHTTPRNITHTARNGHTDQESAFSPNIRRSRRFALGDGARQQ